MKKLVYILIVLFAFASLTSCGSKKKGCGLTGDTSDLPSQEVVVTEITE